MPEPGGEQAPRGIRAYVKHPIETSRARWEDREADAARDAYVRAAEGLPEIVDPLVHPLRASNELEKEAEKGLQRARIGEARQRLETLSLKGRDQPGSDARTGVLGPSDPSGTDILGGPNPIHEVDQPGRQFDIMAAPVRAGNDDGEGQKERWAARAEVRRPTRVLRPPERMPELSEAASAEVDRVMDRIAIHRRPQTLYSIPVGDRLSLQELSSVEQALRMRLQVPREETFSTIDGPRRRGRRGKRKRQREAPGEVPFDQHVFASGDLGIVVRRDRQPRDRRPLEERDLPLAPQPRRRLDVVIGSEPLMKKQRRRIKFWRTNMPSRELDYWLEQSNVRREVEREAEPADDHGHDPALLYPAEAPAIPLTWRPKVVAGGESAETWLNGPESSSPLPERPREPEAAMEGHFGPVMPTVAVETIDTFGEDLTAEQAVVQSVSDPGDGLLAVAGGEAGDQGGRAGVVNAIREVRGRFGGPALRGADSEAVEKAAQALERHMQPADFVMAKVAEGGRTVSIIELGDGQVYRWRNGDLEELTLGPESGGSARGLVANTQPNDRLIMMTGEPFEALLVDDASGIMRDAATAEEAAGRLREAVQRRQSERTGEVPALRGDMAIGVMYLDEVRPASSEGAVAQPGGLVDDAERIKVSAGKPLSVDLVERYVSGAHSMAVLNQLRRDLHNVAGAFKVDANTGEVTARNSHERELLALLDQRADVINEREQAAQARAEKAVEKAVAVALRKQQRAEERAGRALEYKFQKFSEGKIAEAKERKQNELEAGTAAKKEKLGSMATGLGTLLEQRQEAAAAPAAQRDAGDGAPDQPGARGVTTAAEQSVPAVDAQPGSEKSATEVVPSPSEEESREFTDLVASVQAKNDKFVPLDLETADLQWSNAQMRELAAEAWSLDEVDMVAGDVFRRSKGAIKIESDADSVRLEANVAIAETWLNIFDQRRFQLLEASVAAAARNTDFEAGQRELNAALAAATEHGYLKKFSGSGRRPISDRSVVRRYQKSSGQLLKRAEVAWSQLAKLPKQTAGSAPQNGDDGDNAGEQKEG